MIADTLEIKEPDRDRPLCFHWRAVDDDWVTSLDLPAPRSRRHAEARASVLVEALIANLVSPGQWISYSRRKEWWSTGRRYRGSSYSYATVPAAVDKLTALGWLEHDRKPPGNLGWQSRFRATPKLRQRARIPIVIYDPVELIRLKDHDGGLIDYRDTNNTISMRRRLAEINEALLAVELRLHATPVQRDGMLLRLGDNHLVYPAMRSLYRIFNRASFSCGGRFYGGWWQQIPKKLRPNLFIDGEVSVEHDYPQLHPNMLYAEIGARLDGDAYAVNGCDRALVKRAFNILVNAENHDSARRAIALKIGGDGAHSKAAALIEAIKLRHPKIREMFHSDAGIRLQRRDADMAERIMCRLGSHGIAVLPIHDSFISAARHDGALKEAMEITWTQFVGGGPGIFSMRYRKIVPQKEPEPEPETDPSAPSSSSPIGSGPVRPALVVVLPVGRDPDLFGGRPRPGWDLAAWSSGVAPRVVRSYLRDEFRACGLRQSDIARRLEISRPQLVNILRGRFGASPRLTTDLKDFVDSLDGTSRGMSGARTNVRTDPAANTSVDLWRACRGPTLYTKPKPEAGRKPGRPALVAYQLPSE
jgi:hypothetical protein